MMSERILFDVVAEDALMNLATMMLWQISAVKRKQRFHCMDLIW